MRGIQMVRWKLHLEKCWGNLGIFLCMCWIESPALRISSPRIANHRFADIYVHVYIWGSAEPTPLNDLLLQLKIKEETHIWLDHVENILRLVYWNGFRLLTRTALVPYFTLVFFQELRLMNDMRYSIISRILCKMVIYTEPETPGNDVEERGAIHEFKELV